MLKLVTTVLKKTFKKWKTSQLINESLTGVLREKTALD